MTALVIASSARYLMIALLGVLVALMISASWIDWRRQRQQKSIDKRYRNLRPKSQPSVTVIVWARNDEATIERCLRALSANRYVKARFVIVLQDSTDATKRIAGRFLRARRDTRFVSYAPRSSTAMQRVREEAYRRGGRAGIRIDISGSSIVPRRLIGVAAAWLSSDEGIGSVGFYPRRERGGILAMYDRIGDAATNQLRKVFALSSACVAYRVSGGDTAKMNRRGYESRLCVVEYSVRATSETGWKQLANWQRWLLSILVGAAWLLVSYGMTMAALLQTSQVLFVCWLMAIIVAGGVLLSDETMTLKERLGLSFALPSVLFVSYGTVTVRIILTLFERISRLLSAVKSLRFRRISAAS